MLKQKELAPGRPGSQGWGGPEIEFQVLHICVIQKILVCLVYLSEVTHPVRVLLREEEVVRADLAGHAQAAILSQADHLEKNGNVGDVRGSEFKMRIPKIYVKENRDEYKQGCLLCGQTKAKEAGEETLLINKTEQQATRATTTTPSRSYFTSISSLLATWQTCTGLSYREARRMAAAVDLPSACTQSGAEAGHCSKWGIQSVTWW